MNKFLLSCVCAGLASSAVSAVPFQDLIGDDVEVFVTVRSFSETRAQWESHPIAEVFEDESVLSFFEGIEEDLPVDPDSADEPEGFTEVMEEAFGLTYDELFELFPGQASLSFYNVSKQILEEADREEMVLMAEFSGDAERLAELMQIQFERNMEAQQAINPLIEHEMIEESFMGETLYFDETFNGEDTYIEDGYALVDGILVLATPESRLREAVEAIKEGASAPISGSDAYLRAREEGGRGDLAVYVNLEAMLPPLNRSLLEQPMISNLAMFGVTPQSLDVALGLESLQGLYIDFDLIEDGGLSHYGLVYSEKAGFMSLLSYGQGELPEALYVPEGVFSSSVSLFDFGAMLQNFEQLLTQASPTLLPMVDMQLQTMQTQTGVDMRAAILENFGDQMVSLAMLNDSVSGAEQLEQPQQLLVFDVKDTEAFARALETFKDMVPGARSMIKEQTYEGETIYSIEAGNDPNLQADESQDFSYVLTRSKLIINIGNVGLLHEVLTRMNDGSEGLWQNSDTERLFERIERPNAVTRSFVDAEQLIEPFFEAFIDAMEMSGFADDLSMGDAPSDLSASYRLISEMNETPDGLFGRTLIIKSEED